MYVAVDHGGVRPPDCRIYGEYCSCGVDLIEVRVLGARPSAVDPQLLDIDLDGHAWVAGEPPREEYPPAREVLLSGFDNTPHGRCREVAGVYRSRPVPPATAVTLIGCAQDPALLDALAAPHEESHRHAEIHALTAAGDVVPLPFGHGLCLAEGRPRPSALGGGLLDVEFPDALSETLPTGARPIWDRWFEGGPAEQNEWAEHGWLLRQHWARAAGVHRRAGLADRPAGATYHLDGRYVTEMEGFYCALGEAINGPGGYFGWNLDALDDCLRGGFGATAPFTLVWHHSDVAREHLVDRGFRLGRGRTVDQGHLVGLLHQFGSVVELR
jgi:RNAse (barnase) inhibitor barstar